MLISHLKKFIYTKTIKTASTSVEVYFEPYCRADAKRSGFFCEEQVSDSGIIGYRGRNCREKLWYDHMPAKKIREYAGNEVWNEYFKFCVIRNPFEKLVSAYHFYELLIDRSTGSRRAKLMLAHGLTPSKSRDVIKRFRKWVAWTWWFNDRQQYLIDGEICIDFFIRYESLTEDLKTVCERLDIPWRPQTMPWFNSQVRPDDHELTEYYDTKTIGKVCKRFQFEMEHFGYDVPD